MYRVIKSIFMCTMLINTVRASVGNLLTRCVKDCAYQVLSQRESDAMIAQVRQIHQDHENALIRAHNEGFENGYWRGFRMGFERAMPIRLRDRIILLGAIVLLVDMHKNSQKKKMNKELHYK